MNLAVHNFTRCACCGTAYGQGCTIGDCSRAPLAREGQHDPDRYLAEQDRHFDPQAISEVPKTAQAIVREVIARDRTVDLHDLEEEMLDLGYTETETHDAVESLVHGGFCNIDDHSALSLVTRPEPVVEVPRPKLTFWQSFAALFTGGRT